MTLTFPALFAAGLRAPNATLLDLPGEGTWTHADADAASAAVAHGLRASGVVRGHRVAAQADKPPRSYGCTSPACASAPSSCP
jgi:predicted deacylase